MRKYEFLYRLENALNEFAKSEKDEIIHYYEELIQDAIDEGENEEDFIERLGSIPKIVRTIKKDDEFITNVKEKKHFTLSPEFDNTVKTISKIVLILLLIGGIILAFVMMIGGVANIISSFISLFVLARMTNSTNSMIFVGGYILLQIGIILLGISLLIFLTKQSKTSLEWITEKIDYLSKKGKKE